VIDRAAVEPEDFRGDPEGQQPDREMIDDRMQMIRADQLRNVSLAFLTSLE
jgi:hypothetical protein